MAYALRAYVRLCSSISERKPETALFMIVFELSGKGHAFKTGNRLPKTHDRLKQQPGQVRSLPNQNHTSVQVIPCFHAITQEEDT